MAKKKTKPATNPARGVATVSTLSKTRVEQPEVTPSRPEVITPAPNAKSAEGQENVAAVAKTTTSAEPEKSIAELTPEELEQQLESNDLQLLVDKYGVKVRRDVQRQISKIQTDRRVLRGQAQPITMLSWMKDDLQEEAAELVKKQSTNIPTNVATDSRRRPLSAEEIVIKSWTLARFLTSFGLHEPKITDVLKLLMLNPPKEDDESLWGFNEALTMLAAEGNPDLPAFDRLDFDSKVVKVEDIQHQDDSSSAVKDVAPKASQNKTDSSRPATPAANGSQTPSLTNGPSDDEDLDVSDLDSDVEPDQLIPKYLKAKSTLYMHRPDLLDSERLGPKRGRAQASNAPPRPASPSIRKLQNKIKVIEQDPFFDGKLAEVHWVGARNDLAEQAAIDRRLKALQLEGANGKKASSSGTPSGTQSAQDSEDEGLTGGMFATEDDDVVTESTVNGQSGNVRQRNFGKMTGINPRRVLEDACRARDTGVRVHYKQVSPTVYSCRHKVTVNWVKGQERLEDLVHSSISLQQRTSNKDPLLVNSMTFTMVGTSTGEVQSSEAFVATAALFFIFAASPSDGRVNLRLPVAYKDVWNEYEEWRKEQIDSKDRDEIKILRQLYEDVTKVEDDDDDDVILPGAFKGRNKISTPVNGVTGFGDRSATSYSPDSLMSIWQAKTSTPSFRAMLPQRMSLPMFGFKEAALDAIDKHQVLILCGETGCGKSTQLPAYVLEHELSRGRDCKIYCTEPRRISAISLAQRVSEELGEAKSDLGTNRSLVGYAIRLETKVAQHTKLVYATVGIVLRMLESSRSLNDVTHLIIDEVHERSIDTDFLLVILRSLMTKRPELKVILMSATVDATKFSNYLDNAPVVNVPGRTFPVSQMFLEDAIELTHHKVENKRGQETEYDADDEVPAGNAGKLLSQLQGYSPSTREVLSQYDEYRIDFELIVRLIKHVLVDPTYAPFSKAILVFLPGIGEIRELNDLLGGESMFQHGCIVYPLHSSIASEEQQAAFQIPPPGVRKIVLATNIAETGITIPDVTCVIDTGKHKEMRYDERRQLSRLIMSFISRANAKQRRGRAGRVQEGLCFHLFTKHRHDELMAEQQTPEMLRLSLQDLVMRVKICKLGDIEQTLAQALDPPSAKNIRRAIDALIEVGALTSSQELTDLGSQLAKLPLDANLGKLCLYSAIFSCLDVGLTVAAILSSKSPFVTPFGQRQAADLARLSFNKWGSDLITAYNAYEVWRRVSQDHHTSAWNFCRKNFLSHQNLTAIEDLKGQLLTAMGDTGLLSHSQEELRRHRHNRGRGFVQIAPDMNRHNEREVIVTAVTAWSFYPKILSKDGKGWRQISNSQSITLHPSSINRALPTHNVKYLSYYSLMQSSSGNKAYNALSTTAAPDMMLLLLAGAAEWKLHAGVVVVDAMRLRFRLPDWRSAIVLKGLRARLEEIVARRLKEPGRGLDARLSRWMEIWERVCGVEEGLAS